MTRIAIVVLTLMAVDAVASPAASAQGGTDIFVTPLSASGISVRVGEAKHITRRAGYDNQPAFTTNGKAVLYTSQRAGQTDIYRYDVDVDSSVQLTRTKESEYSATLLPDKSGFSVIRVEADSTQRLWAFRHDGTRPRLLLQAVKPVGYHAWANPRELILFVLGDPPTLQRARMNSSRVDTLAQNPGRSLHKVPGKNSVSFVHKKSPEEWWIRELDIESGRITDLVRTLPGSEDYAWTPTGILLMASGASLHSWNSRLPETGWSLVHTFKDKALRNIKRLAISADGARLALVSDEP